MGALGPLGAKQGSQYAIGKDGAGQGFAGGKIFYSPATGANVVSGQVLKKYESVGGPEGDLGFPTSNEADGGLKTGSRVSTFSAEDEPVIFWTPDYGAFIVRGAMNAAWSKLGGAAGALGPPVADQTEDGNVVTQRFTGGEISWDKQTNKFSTQPANLSSGLGRAVGAGLRTARGDGSRPRRIPRSATGLRPHGGGCSPAFRCWCWSDSWPSRRCGTGAAARRIRWTIRSTSTPPTTPPPRPRRCGWQAPMTSAGRGCPTVTVGHRDRHRSVGRGGARSVRPARR